MELAALTVDSFLFALAWVVQLIVYPSFRWVNSAENPNWHRIYTYRIVILTLPTMLAQLVLHAIIAYSYLGTATVLSLSLVMCSWALTFGYAVQLHKRISIDGPRPDLVNRLLRVHGLRTAVWSLVFLMQIFHML